MSNLTAFNQDGIEIYIDNTTGESFASISGYARMSGLTRQAISKRVNSAATKEALKQLEVPTGNGFRTATVISENLIVEWLIDDNSQLAKKMLKLGVRVFLHQLAGFKVTSSAIQHEIPTTYIDALKSLIAAEEEKEKLRLETVELMEENIDLQEFKSETSQYEQFIELLDITRTEVSNTDYVDGITVFDYLIQWNNDETKDSVDIDDWHTISKRASSYYRLLEGRHPDKNNKNRNIFKGKKVAYIIATIKLVKSGI